jgi:hypothetical protein
MIAPGDDRAIRSSANHVVSQRSVCGSIKRSPLSSGKQIRSGSFPEAFSVEPT